MHGTRKSTLPPAPTFSSASLQAGEGLAGAAGHDQLAAVVLAEAGGDLVDRGALVRRGAASCRAGSSSSGVVERELRPVDPGVPRGRTSPIRRTGIGLALDRVLGVGVPLVGGRDDDPLAEPVLARGRRGRSRYRLGDRAWSGRRTCTGSRRGGRCPCPGDQVDAGVVLAAVPGHSLHSQTSANWSANTGSIRR